MRTPLLPFAVLRDWSAGVGAAAAGPDDLGRALAADRRVLRARLVELVARPEIREALFVASPSLDDSLPAWLEQPDGERGLKVERSLVRYLARMAGRATPFGLFAGCSVGTLGDATQLAIEGRDRYRRHTRLDGDYLATLAAAIVADPDLRRHLRFRPNSGAYRIAGRLRFAEARLDGKLRSYHLVAFELTDYLEATIARAAAGARLDDLAAALVDDEISREEADAFVADLVTSQLLVPDLEPQVTGDEPIHGMIEQLGAAAATRPIAAVLDHCRTGLANLDAAPLGVAPASYRSIASGLEELPAELERSRLFQVDLVKPAPLAALGPGVMAEVVRAVTVCSALGTTVRNSPLNRFRDAFVNRYQDREVALAEALDEESGIGFDLGAAHQAEASPLLEGLAFGRPPPGDEDAGAGETAGSAAVTGLLLRRLDACLRAGGGEIVLEQADLDRLVAQQEVPVEVARSIAVMATLAAASPEALAAGDFLLHVHGIGGPSGANLLGRFCHGDPRLTELVRQHLRDEEAGAAGAVFAEIVHLPEGRIGNVLLRPVLRDHEIPYLGRSGAPADRQLPIDDLAVSVRGDRVVLRSRRLGREVVPRLTTAHNFSSPLNLGLYRFLCALPFQGLGRLGLSWGVLERAPFLPRVRCGRLVLDLARWRIERDELEPIGKARGDRVFAAVQALRHARGLPRWIAVADGDNQLPVDLDNALVVDTFAQLVGRRDRVTLTELFEPERLCASGPEGGFVHELVVPLVVESAPRPLAVAPAEASVGPRLLLPGSDWLYLKLYAGTAAVDRVLRDAVAPVVAEVLGSGAATSWFFIRYGDPDWHLRLRFRGEPGRLRGEVLPRLTEAARACVDAGLVWKVQVDSYDREVERYGGDHGVVLAEELFRADSDACLAIVDTLSGDEGADARWRLALRGMDMLFDDLGFDLAGRHQVVAGCRRGFAAEFRADRGLDHQLGDKFRGERVALEQLLDRANDAGSPLEPGLVALAARSPRVAAIGAELRALERDGKLGQSLPALAASYLHMHANRLLRAAARAQELVIYDFLDRLYRGQIARARRSRSG